MNSTALATSFIDVFAAPGNFFNGLLNVKTKTWLAFLLLIAVTSGGTLYFFSGMSNEWIIEQQMLHVQTESPSEEKEIKSFLMETAQYTGALGAIFNAIFYVVLVSVLAGYYKLIGRKNEQLTYNNWFAFSVWTQMPLIVHMLGLIALVVTANSPEVPLSLVNYASFNQLFVNLPIGHVFYDLAETLNLFFLWSIFLAAVGLKSWANMPTGKAAMFAILPYVLVFGIWAIVA